MKNITLSVWFFFINQNCLSYYYNESILSSVIGVRFSVTCFVLVKPTYISIYIQSNLKSCIDGLLVFPNLTSHSHNCFSTGIEIFVRNRKFGE